VTDSEEQIESKLQVGISDIYLLLRRVVETIERFQI